MLCESHYLEGLIGKCPYYELYLWQYQTTYQIASRLMRLLFRAFLELYFVYFVVFESHETRRRRIQYQENNDLLWLRHSNLHLMNVTLKI